MSEDAKKIFSQVMQLDHSDQLDLVREILSQIENHEAGFDLLPEQVAELKARLADLEAGKAKSIPGELAMESFRLHANS